MPEYRVEHTFACSEETFWGEVFFEEDYNRRLFLDWLHFTRWCEVSREQRHGLMHRVVAATPPMGDLPKPIQSLFGDETGFKEHGVFDPARRSYKAQVVPNRLSDRISIQIELSTEATSPQQCKRIAQATVGARIFGLGGMLEKKMIADVADSFEQTAEFTKSYIDQKGKR
jgi:hypothetical protein